jgi:hypothetical protein
LQIKIRLNLDSLKYREVVKDPDQLKRIFLVNKPKTCFLSRKKSIYGIIVSAITIKKE